MITIRSSWGSVKFASPDVPGTAHAPRHLNGRRQAAAGLLLESVRILFDRLQVAEGVRDRLLDRAQDRIRRRGQAVVHPQPLLAGVDQARTPQIREVAGRLRL